MSLESRMRWRQAGRRARRLVTEERSILMLLVIAAVTMGIGSVIFEGAWPLTSLLIPLTVASVFLGPRLLPWFVILVLVVLTIAISLQAAMTLRSAAGTAVIFLIGLIIMLASFRRTSLGVGGMRGESMLVDLRDRILRQGRLPALPSDWYAESALRSASGSPFAGDLVLAARRGQQVDIVVVDVSGKGEEVGTRALLLSGAFASLLSEIPAEEFLPAANRYLARQEWLEGFATCIHLTLDLDSGDFAVRAAGHPPAIQVHAGSGRRSTHEPEGPFLGLIDEADYEPVRGNLAVGDAVLLYTDGMVESATRDLASGIDRLAGAAERMLAEGFEYGAGRLIEALGSPDDDRAVVLVHRR